MLPPNQSTSTPVQKTGLIAPSAIGVEVTELLKRNPGYQAILQWVPGTDSTQTPGLGGSITVTYFHTALNGDTVTALLALATVAEGNGVPGA